MRYPVVLTPDDNDTILLTCPDIPEVAAIGADEDEALLNAVDAVEDAIADRIARREPVPSPSRVSSHSVALRTLPALKVAIYHSMIADAVGKAELARRLAWHLPQVDRILDIGHASRMDQIEAALAALGRRVEVEVLPAD